MPIDPRIPLSVYLPESEQDVLGKRLEIRQRQQSIDNNDLIYRQNQDDYNRNQQLRAVLQKHGSVKKAVESGDVDKIDVYTADQWREGLAKAEAEANAAQIDSSGKASDLIAKQTGRIANVLTGIQGLDNTKSLLTPESMQQLDEELTQAQHAVSFGHPQHWSDYQTTMADTINHISPHLDSAEGNPADREFFTAINAAQTPEQALKVVQQQRAAGIGHSIRTAAYKTSDAHGFGNPGSGPGGVDIAGLMGLPREYDEAKVNAAIQGFGSKEDRDAQRAADANRVVDTSKGLDLIGRLGGNVNSTEEIATLRKTAADAGVPATALARMPTRYDPASWAKFMDSLRTPEQRASEPLVPVVEGGKLIYRGRSRAEGQQAPLTASLMNNGFGGFGGGGPQSFDAAPPTAETAKKLDPRTGLTFGALDEAAKTWALSGAPVYPSRGMSQAQVRNAMQYVQNKGSEIARVAGVDIATLRQEFKANGSAISQMMPQFQAMSAIKGQAEANMANALAASDTLPRTGSPFFNNRYFNYISGGKDALTGNPAYSQFEQYIYDSAREYARLTTGGAASAAQLNQSAAARADELINAAQTPDAFRASIGAMHVAMNNVITAYTNQIGRFSKSPMVGRFLQVAATGEPPTGAVPETGGVGGPGGVVYGTRPDGTRYAIPGGR